MGSQTSGAKDGRTVRAERTRQALVDALFALLDEGELRPTAERIAKRAGVSERSVFQHFPDREALFEAVARQQYERVFSQLEPVDPSLPLTERIDAFVAQRARLLEESSSVRRAALLLEHESEVVAGWLDSLAPGGGHRGRARVHAATSRDASAASAPCCWARSCPPPRGSSGRATAGTSA